MRVTENLTRANINTQIQRAQSRFLQASREASSGSRIDRPSSDPIAAAQFTRIQQALDGTSSQRGAIRIVQGDVQMAESVLASAGDVMSRVQEIALQGANGATDADARRMLAQEVGQLREQLISLANQKGTQGYLFSGTAIQTEPFSQTGVFQGNDLDRMAPVGPRQSMTVNVSGARAFTAAGGRDLFADLQALQAGLQADDQSAILATVNSLGVGQRQVLAARADAGLKMNRLGIADTALSETELSLSSQRHDVADADPTEAYTRLSATQSGLETAIAASKSILSTLGKGWL